jgi:hypothetical protein
MAGDASGPPLRGRRWSVGGLYWVGFRGSALRSVAATRWRWALATPARRRRRTWLIRSRSGACTVQRRAASREGGLQGRAERAGTVVRAAARAPGRLRCCRWRRRRVGPPPTPGVGDVPTTPLPCSATPPRGQGARAGRDQQPSRPPPCPVAQPKGLRLHVAAFWAGPALAAGLWVCHRPQLSIASQLDDGQQTAFWQMPD